MRKIACLLVIVASVVSLGSCLSIPPEPDSQAGLHTDTSQALADLKVAFPELEAKLASAPGYAVFPTIAKGGAGLGGAHGVGEVFEGTEFVGYCAMTQGSIGIQLGGQAYRQIVIFSDERALKRFKIARLVGALSASGVVGSAGGNAAAGYEPGVEIYAQCKGGLMFEASVGGQQFTFVPKDLAN